MSSYSELSRVLLGETRKLQGLPRSRFVHARRVRRSDGDTPRPSFAPRFSRAARAASSLLATALLLGVVLPSAAFAQNVGPSLTLSGPEAAFVNEPTQYTGRLAVSVLGAPIQTIGIFLDGSSVATAQTDVNGNYSVSITFTASGLHDLEARWLQTTSPIRTVEVATPKSAGGPAPTLTAPQIDRTVATTVFAATKFLYSGPSPVQTGVAAGVIEPARAAVIRGRVIGHDGAGIAGVDVRILGHPELGLTRSRSDGYYDIAVNGGGRLSVVFERDGYVAVERDAAPGWQDYAVLDQVVLTTLDPNITTVDVESSTSTQIARGSEVTDSDGTRQATLLFEPGTTAQIELPSGRKKSIDELSVRATELTVGSTGEQAMPADLPPSSGYTYAVELSADEADQYGAEVLFSKPVINYVENFIGFPVGTAVPTGYFDRARGLWVAAENGVVIEIVSETAGVADVDADGDGDADSSTELADLGLDNSERQSLASLYDPGTSLWRVEVDHFTPWDHNWPFGPPSDAVAPVQPGLGVSATEDGNCVKPGSIIECQSQVLQERLPLSGLPLELVYSSERAAGRKAVVDIPLSGATVPPSLKRIDVEIEVAGERDEQSFDPDPNQSWSFTWDGLDVYGRTLQGAQRLSARVGYVYDAIYQEPAEQAASFARFGMPWAPIEARSEVTIWQSYTSALEDLVRRWDAGWLGLGGWSLDVHHAYDPVGRVLYLGTGERQSAQPHELAIPTIAGTGTDGAAGDGGPAKSAQLSNPDGVDVGADGSIYVADAGNGKIRKIDPERIITTVAAGLSSPADVAVGPDGRVLIADSAYIKEIGPQGNVTTLSRPGTTTGDGENSIHGLAVGPDGTIYAALARLNCVRAVGTDGSAWTVAGTCDSNGNGFSGDGGPARSAELSRPEDVAVATDGTLFIADRDNFRVRRVTPDGVITTIAGDGTPGFSGDGIKATNSSIRVEGIAVGPDGMVYTSHNSRIRKITPEGYISTVAGSGDSGFGGQDGPAAAAKLDIPQGLAVLPDGRLVIADWRNDRVRAVAPPVPGFSGDDIVVTSKDGGEIYHFSPTGKHLRTLDGLTGVVIHRFAYDSEGRLLTVTDRDDDVTTIERDGLGAPTAVVSPFGVRTEIGLDANGYLDSLTDPEDGETSFTTTSEGLLTEMVDPNEGVHEFSYDAEGRLTRDEDPSGGYTTLDRTELVNGYRVTATTAEGHASIYETVRTKSGDVKTIVTAPGGAVSDSVMGRNGEVVTTLADGTEVTVVTGPDPRWGMQVPVAKSTKTVMPSGKTRTVTSARSVTLGHPDDLLSLTSQTDTTTSNTNTTTTAFVVATRTSTTTTPEGRATVSVLNAKARVASIQVGDLAEATFDYDAHGRLTEILRTAGSAVRKTTLDYDSLGYVSSAGSALNETTFENDGVGRVTTATLPDSNQIGYAYDAMGNLTALTPPGRTAHAFEYTGVDLTERYLPPALGGGTDYSADYGYNLDRQPTTVSLPGDRSIVFAYDTSGRPASTTLDRGVITHSYDPETSQLASIEAPGAESLDYSYDGALLSQVVAGGVAPGSVAYGYDNDFRVSSRTINAGPPVSFAFDLDGLLTSAGALTLTRRPVDGQVASTTLGTVGTTHSYNDFGEPSSDSTSGGLYSATYERDDLGRIVSKSETIGGATSVYDYSYDERGRLIDAEKDSSPWRHYDYDANGNRTGATEDGASVTGSYDAQDRMTSYGTTDYTYNAMGQLATKTTAAQTTTYDYDEFGSLTNVTLPDKTIDYVVDGLGRRVARKVDGATTHRFLYGKGIQPVAELDASGGVKSQFVYASKTHVPDLMTKNGTNYRFITDQVGSVRLVVNTATGAVAQRIDYDPFGKVLNDTNPGFQPFGFAGGLQDPATELVRFGARDYDPTTGRWTAKDLILFAGGDSNLFAYTASNPINSFDPAGLATGGLCVSFSFLGDVSQFCLIADDDGNVGISVSSGSGEQVPYGLSGSAQAQGTSADTIHDLDGAFDYLGGSAGPLTGPGVAADVFTSCPDEGARIVGYEVGPSLGVPPVDIHAGQGETTVHGFNLFEVISDVGSWLNPFG